MTYAKYVEIVSKSQKEYDLRKRRSEFGLCVAPITLRPEIISQEEFEKITKDAK